MTYAPEDIANAFIRTLFILDHKRLDTILDGWKSHEGDFLSSKNDFDQFMAVIMAPIKIRMKDQCIYFTEDDRSKLHFCQMYHDEQMLFSYMIKPSNVDVYFKTCELPSNSISINASPSYSNFTLDSYVERIFPRHIICGRLVARALHKIKFQSNIEELYMILKMAVNEYSCGPNTADVMRIAYEILAQSVSIIRTNTWHPKKTMFPDDIAKTYLLK